MTDEKVETKEVLETELSAQEENATAGEKRERAWENEGNFFQKCQKLKKEELENICNSEEAQSIFSYVSSTSDLNNFASYLSPESASTIRDVIANSEFVRCSPWTEATALPDAMQHPEFQQVVLDAYNALPPQDLDNLNQYVQTFIDKHGNDILASVNEDKLIRECQLPSIQADADDVDEQPLKTTPDFLLPGAQSETDLPGAFV